MLLWIALSAAGLAASAWMVACAWAAPHVRQRRADDDHVRTAGTYIPSRNSMTVASYSGTRRSESSAPSPTLLKN
jgi:hypothetical protein